MRRGRDALTSEEFDILVIGAGIFGACVAWCAALRGYSVALIDKGDFGAATSSNHYKFIHGGIRYLQHLDFKRLRESSREKSALIRIAPHLAYPLPVVLPTYGHGKRGKAIMRAAMLAYDVLTLDRNCGISDPARQTARGSTLSRDEALRMYPGLADEGLTGAAVFFDGQMYNPARIVLSFIRSAVERGTVAANYVEAGELLRQQSRIVGCKARDSINDADIEIRGRVVVNAAGPWAHRLLRANTDLSLAVEPSFSRDLAFVVNKSICTTHALGCQASSQDTDAVLDRGGRHLFLVPWRGRTLVGVWHQHSRAHPERIAVSQEELSDYVLEINSAYPPIEITVDDIEIVNTGLILFGSETAQGSSESHSFAKRSMLVDHARSGHEGLITLVGARATVARGMAVRTLDLIDNKLGNRRRRDTSAHTPIWGGDFSDFEALVNDIARHLPDADRSTVTALGHNYGARYKDVLDCAADEADLKTIGSTRVLRAEAIHAVRREMAHTLEDVVMRRTELGSAGHPGREALETAAGIVAAELGWGDAETGRQLDGLDRVLGQRGPWNFVDESASLGGDDG